MTREEYKEKVKAGLIGQPIGKIIDMEDTVSPKNRELFIAVVKEFINKGLGNSDGWECEFNNSYTRYRKISIKPR